MKKLAADIGERGVQEGNPEMAGNRMHLIFGPGKKGIAPAKKSEGALVAGEAKA
jgi:hypothetical protein